MSTTLPSILRRILAALSTFLLTTAIACLVWLYAVQQNVRPQDQQSVMLRFGSADQRQNYVILPEAPVKVVFSFTSSNGRFNHIHQDLLKSGSGGLVIPLKLDDDAPSSQNIPVSLKDALRDSVLKGTGATDLKIYDQGDTYAVVAERLVTVELPLEEHHDPVRIPVPPTLGADHPITQIKVRLPASLAAKLKGAKALVDINKLDLTGTKPGEKITRTLPVEIPALTDLSADLDNPTLYAKKHITLEPASMEVSLTPEKITSELTVARSITINISAPPALLDSWKFEIGTDELGRQQSKYLNDLRLVGSREAIDAVAANEKDTAKPKLVWAVIRIRINGKDNSPTDGEDNLPTDGNLKNMQVELITPPGVQPAQPELLPKLTVHATRRNATE